MMRLRQIHENDAPSLRATRAETWLTVYRALWRFLSLSYSNIFLVQAARQIQRKVTCAFSKLFCLQTKISRVILGTFLWGASQIEINACSFRFWKREAWEKSVARDWLESRFWHDAPFSSFVRSLDVFRCFCDLRIFVEKKQVQAQRGECDE